MKYILFIISIFLFNLHLSAQDALENVLAGIERNNTTLGALRQDMEAQKIGNRTDLFLQNPEIGFNYLWETPSVIGDRRDVSISQTFDFPTAYRYNNQLSSLKNEQVELEYQKHRMDILLETKLVCFDLIYTNALLAELSKRLVHAQSIERSFKLKFEKGDTNILEYNKAKLNLLNVNRELESLTIERSALLSELTRLNGGIPLDFTQSSFQMPAFPANFDQWYVLAEQRNPSLGWLKKEVEMSQKQADLNRALSLPNFQTGYMSEQVAGEQFQGVTLGMSIPLWENKNKVKYARANALAVESRTTDQKLQFYIHLKALHSKAVALQQHVIDYRTALQSIDNTKLSKKALDYGEISLINYMVEFSLYYESVDQLLELEREMNKANAELNQYQ
jgi:outer membrane protein TolC